MLLFILLTNDDKMTSTFRGVSQKRHLSFGLVVWHVRCENLALSYIEIATLLFVCGL